MNKPQARKIVRQLPLNLFEQDQEHLTILRLIYPKLKTEADILRDALSFRVAAASQSEVRRARRTIANTTPTSEVTS